MAVYIDQLRLMDALTAEEITHVDLRDAFRARFGNPYAVVHRGDLHGVFLKACQDHELIELRVSSEVIGYDQDGSSVTARLASGERVTGSLLIGADGLWSNIRKQVVGGRAAAGVRPHHLSLGDSDRADAGRSALERGDAVGRPEMPHRALSAVGLEGVQPRRHLSQRRAGAGRGQAGVRRGSDAGLCAMCMSARRNIIRHGKNWRLWVLCDRDPVERWIDGRVALLGDAAHPMLQYFAQGACQAMEDAVCLSHMLAQP